MPSSNTPSRPQGRRQQLTRDVRLWLERALGVDLGAVGVRTGRAVDAWLAGQGADGAASGTEVYVRQDRAGDPWLLAHEVAHLVQQAQGERAHGSRGWQRLEQAADAAADAAVAGRRWRGPRQAAPRALAAAPVQRHDSFEHRALGDVSTADIMTMAGDSTLRKGVLDAQVALMQLWETDPLDVTAEQIAAVAPGVRTLRLNGSGLLVTYGEINALPDYVANAGAIDTLPQEVLLPILQLIRQESFNRFNALAGTPTSTSFAQSPIGPNTTPIGLLNKILETSALDGVTQALGFQCTDHYNALLARNACHFAPYSWYRWEASFRMAGLYAMQANQDPFQRARFTQLAWTYAGYADHFLQDSFAAGHLINKTLVMQFFVEWAANSVLPIADWDLIKDLTTAEQPNLGGMALYAPDYSGQSTDPQTVEEQATYAERVALSGIMASAGGDLTTNYQDYLTFLSSLIAQAISGATHDYYNANSLWVASNYQPQAFEIWGDDTLFGNVAGTMNAAPGAGQTSEAAQLSQEAINEILASGQTGITLTQIRDRFPTMVQTADGSLVTLEAWQTGALESFVKNDILSSTNVETWLKRIGTLLSPRIPNVSQDQDLAVRWSASLPNTGFTTVDTVVLGGRVFAASAGRVFELRPGDGTILQSATAGTSGEMHLATDGQLLYVSWPGYVDALNPDGLTSAWPQPTPMKGLTSYPVSLLCAYGRLFAGSNGMAFELSRSTGAMLHDITLVSPITVGAPVHLATDGANLYAGCNGYAYGFSLMLWQAGWSTPLKGVSSKEATVLLSGGSLYVGSNGYVQELNPSTGAMLHSLLLSSAVGVGDYRVALATDGTTLYAGIHGYAYGVDLSDWSTVAEVGLAGTYYSATGVLLQDGSLIVASNGYVNRVDAASGSGQTGRLVRSAELAFKIGAGDYTPSIVSLDPSAAVVGMHGYVYLVATTLPD